MRYDFYCSKCNLKFEVDKQMSAPKPNCPHCDGNVERSFGKEDIPAIHYAGRPPWTYNDAKTFKRVSDGATSYDTSSGKHGDLGSWDLRPPVIKKKPKKGQK